MPKSLFWIALCDEVKEQTRQSNPPADKETLEFLDLIAKRCPVCGQDGVEVIADPQPVLAVLANLNHNSDLAP